MKVVITLNSLFRRLGHIGKGTLGFTIDHIVINPNGDWEIRTKTEDVPDGLKTLMEWTDNMVAGKYENGKQVHNVEKFYKDSFDKTTFESWVILVPKVLLDMISSRIELGERV